MAQYKVPQDVEADDKLLGPFNFRQFVYLLVAAGLIALAVALFQIFPLLAILPLPPVLLFLALALPLKKDQPMETYLAAIVSYYLKPRDRRWMPGQKETTILITAPKIVEEVRSRDISQEEATHRLSFLADVVDSEGYAIRGGGNSMREDLVAEANAISDMFDETNQRTSNLDRAIAEDKAQKHEEAINSMRAVMREAEAYKNAPMAAERGEGQGGVQSGQGARVAPSGVDGRPSETNERPNGTNGERDEKPKQNLEVAEKPKAADPNMVELANNPDYSIETIAKEAKRIKRKDENEVFVSLH